MTDGPTHPGGVLAAPVDLGGTGYYIHWGVLQISAANAVVIALMLLVFVLALFLPFPGGRRRR
ncbi:hypothetical protein ABT154_12425 [Streptomyces sp. NPDC001728]|uniref:hypothetical protein n=1 Tax=Streptomyces sp. NPDC001728 TaxID=3154396 RepID=UPI00332F094F